MPKQNQIIAIEKGAKESARKVLTEAYHRFQKTDLLIGLTRVYTPKDLEGDKLPPEKKLVQVRVHEEMSTIEAALIEMFDVTASKEWGNTEARADVELDGRVLLEQVPVTYLLFLEKQLTDISTLVRKLPILDPAEDWHFDEAANCFVSEATEQLRTKKMPRNHVKFAGDDNHPPQVEVYYEDVAVGTYRTTKMSGAMTSEAVARMLERVQKLSQAVKQAREKANGLDVERRKVAKKVFDYIVRGDI